MPKTLKPKPLPPMTEARFKRWATQDASIHVTHFRRVLAALEYERARAGNGRPIDELERCACNHLLRNHFKAGNFACKVANCGCPRYVGV